MGFLTMSTCVKYERKPTFFTDVHKVDINLRFGLIMLSSKILEITIR
jgi:hypothetical protein